ncbi:MAG: glucose/galactose MFS transporter [Prevotellaceae bacterium]|jgi:fucose permease|nr:glucose/galactose MFS transporter [Prevotellaceae bacterium]
MKQENSYTLGIFTLTMLFVICGFTMWLNATLVPYLKVACELSNVQAYFVTLVFYLACAAAVFPSLRLLSNAEPAGGMAIGLMSMAAGALIFIPAALLRTYPLFLLGLLVAGAGLGLLQVAAGTCASALGASARALRRRNALHICGTVAGVAGTLAVGSILFYKIDSLEASIRIAEGASRAAELDTLAHKVVLPYLVITLTLLAAAVWVKYSPLPNTGVERSGAQEAGGGNAAHPLRLGLGALALFLYVGAEVTGVVSIALYGKSVGISLAVASALPACALLVAVLGCLLGAAVVPKHIDGMRAVGVCAALGVIFAVAAVLAPDGASVAFVALLGLSASPAWLLASSLTAKAGRSLGARAVALAAGALGGALLPLAYGYLADTVGNRHAYWLLAPCYAAVLLYAVFSFPAAKKNTPPQN